MRRVLVLGCPGSGKSTLATALSARLDLPLVHLDRLFWRPRWIESPREEFLVRQEEALPRDGRWVADGNYGGTLRLRLERADTIVLLDVPTAVCLARVIARSWRHLGRVRPDQSDGCPERLFTRGYLEFLLYVARYRRRSWPNVLAKIAAHAPSARRFHLRSDAGIARFLDGIKRGDGGTTSTPAGPG